MEAEIIKVQAPGRINIIGEHVDYNDGFVLPAAINKNTVFNLKKNGSDKKGHITAENLGESFSFDITSFHPTKKGGWPNYVMGVIHELQNLGASIQGFEGTFKGNVPIGGGMSSSAALECSLASGLNELFDLGINKWDLIKACQMAEHNFVGIKCGIMDQFASMMGKKDHAMLLDCRSLNFEYVPMDLGNHQLLLLNTNVSHALASSEYNTRRSECEEGVKILKAHYPEITKLRDVSKARLIRHKEELPDHIYRRCSHVVWEIERTHKAKEALLKNDYWQLGNLIYQSHFSLQNDYKVSCSELDFLVQQTLDKEYVLGSRMMGGGFGGCTLNLIEVHRKEEFIDNISNAYRAKFGIDLSIYTVYAEEGTSQLTQTT